VQGASNDPAASAVAPAAAAPPQVDLSAQAPAARPSAIRKQRALLLVTLIAGVSGLTGVMLALCQSMADDFAAQVEAGLEWRALRGAQELSRASELGVAVSDTALFNKALDVYAASPDDQAIAVRVGGQILISRGDPAVIAPVFTAQPGTVVHGQGFVASWAPALAKGVEVGQIAVVVSTRRFADAQIRQAEVSLLMVVAGIVATLLGAVVILFLTRWAAAGPAREALSGDAAPRESPRRARTPTDRAAAKPSDEVQRLTEQLEEKSDELAEHQRNARPEATLGTYLSVHSHELADKVTAGLERICEGIFSLDSTLEQLPKRITAEGRTYQIKYVPLLVDDRPDRLLLIITDVTEQVARERELQEQRTQREMAALSHLIETNRAEFDEFFAEAVGLISALEAPSEPEAERRTLHTLKDNCAYYGIESFVELCQSVEDALAATGGTMSDEHRIALANGWAALTSGLARRSG
jgi:HPt (histidine-containing phosphotransfer) domain-containing protein